MTFAGRFHYTTPMVRHLMDIEAARGIIAVHALPPDATLYLRSVARQRATMGSTAIEGNTLSAIEAGNALAASDRKGGAMHQEVRNYWRALEWAEEQREHDRPIDEAYICELHRIILVVGHGRRGVRSRYRVTECPVVDQVTRAVDYAPPEPADVPKLMRDLSGWLASSSAQQLPAPVRAGLFAHRFISIHPFGDGNGRTARALATAELWKSGYDLRGFLSLEEYYAADLSLYYDSLQMGLPVNFYDGRHDPDHTQWLEYFLGTMAKAANALRRQAEALYKPSMRPAPWESLSRRQQQLLMRLLLRRIVERHSDLSFTPGDIALWYGVSTNTAREWLANWTRGGYLGPARPGAERIRRYRVHRKWETLIADAAAAADSTSRSATR